jgi:molybdopterin-containing oxidoreductase family iron-sulfur binding subunit
MVYNRCVGTRYCANNCPYTARRFNYHTWEWPQSYHLMLNPELSTREMGVMEKCTFCVQRLRTVKDNWRDAAYAARAPGEAIRPEQHRVPDAALQRITACAAACPSEAINFGNWNDTDSLVRTLGNSPRAYTLFGELNTKPGVRYMAKVAHHAPVFSHHGGGHGEDHGSEDGHGKDTPPTGAHGGHGGDHAEPAHGQGAGHTEG